MSTVKLNYPKLGEIILMNFDPQVGHEMAKLRPALVVSRSLLSENTNFVWVCPITSTIKGYPTCVLLDGTTKTQGEINVNQMRSLDYDARGWKALETVPTAISQEVANMIKAITNFNEEEDSEN